ncbi:CdaR family protein [Robertkochia aurantiaca]|uniref:CdaR family protein n=1 Tax=Robertkochia aurantiaca TaxID=2873700 RepID=UPI001CCC52E0|nr:YbbR-like domain-containing protein [Robertkochia sp. 3YJGBD-33]
MSNILKRYIKKPKAVIFLLFLIISAFIWVVITLSDRYDSRIAMDLDYINIPEEKLLIGNPPEQINVNIESSGFGILYYRLFRQTLFLNAADFKPDNNAYYLLGEEVQEVISEQYKSLEINRVVNDSIKIRFGENQTRAVPVKARIDLSFVEDYELVDSLVVEPDSVWIHGPEDIVNSIDTIPTEILSLKNVQADFEHRMTLSIPDTIQKLSYEPRAVTVSGKVERFSEKIVTVPVQVINAPEDVTVKTFPGEIRVLCKAAISDLKRVNPASFKVVCDFNDTRENASFLIPRIAEKPSFIISANLLETKVEYLIKRL